MIEDYDLKKTKLAFSIFKPDLQNQDSYQRMETVFSDVMEEDEKNKKAPDTISKSAMRSHRRKRRCSNANDRLSTSESDVEEGAYTLKGSKRHLKQLSERASCKLFVKIPVSASVQTSRSKCETPLPCC